MRALKIAAIYAASIAVLLAFLAPILWLVNISLKLRRDIFIWPPAVFDFEPTLENYANVLSASGRFLDFMTNSFLIALMSTAIAVTVGALAAFGLGGRRRRKSFLWSYWMLSFRMMPPVVLIIPFYILAQSAGALGQLWTIAIAHSVFSIAVVIWMMKNFFDKIPQEVEEAAVVDGATQWQIFRMIALPISKAAMTAAAIFAFITSWNDFLFAIMLSDSDSQTVTVGIGSYVGEVYVSWGELAAATVLAILPAMFFSFLGQRYLLAGFATGSVK